jgi:cyclopropane fatty-acyl-phospholipid synthase-like methyltransferase
MDKPPPTEDAREEAQIAYWNDATAANWVALEERIDPVLAPLSTLALEAAAPKPGERALDIGSGCGGTVLQLAERVGPTGHFLGIDVSVPMSAFARERIEAARLANTDGAPAAATRARRRPPGPRAVCFRRRRSRAAPAASRRMAQFKGCAS